MARKLLPPAGALRQLLEYNPDDGSFLWLPRTGRAFFNARYAGRAALTATDADGYKTGSIFGVKCTAHRVAWAWWHGDWPEDGMFIDHINGDPADNRISNLRVVTRTENNRNKALQLNNTSGVQGVSWHKNNRSWDAAIKVGGRLIHLGSYTEKDDAIAARRSAEVRHQYHPNHGRVTDKVASRRRRV